MGFALGPFDLLAPIGSGGMGAIWRGVHQQNRVPVAIKIIKEAATEEFREAFLHEVRLVAGLRHRNVILALDAGLVPERAAKASKGKLVAGAPYLAMELAGGGSLADHRVRQWSELRHVLLGLLDGLAHAHARGVIHRDIKPGNLLVAGDRSELASRPKRLLSARMVLTDFGISSRRDLEELFGDDAVGTPAYMAPEQVRGEWRDQGPWTDLYAVGVLAFKLACGRQPYKRPNSALTMMAHLREPVPPVQPIFEVPLGFEGWVRTLLAKKPSQRFGYASDARRALVALGEVSPATAPQATLRLPRILDDDDLPTERNTATSSEISLITGAPSAPITGTASTRGTWSPKAWSDSNRQDFRLAGAGLGLYGLRDIPLVDRVGERDLLWGALVGVRTSQQPRAIVLRGPSGTGKSRLARWLAETAHEAGAGQTLRAALGGAEDAGVLTRLAEAGLRCEGLRRPEVLERVEAHLGDRAPEEMVQALSQVVAPKAFAKAPPLSRKEAHAAMERYLGAVAGERSVLVWLDDAHLSLDALAFARRMLDARDPVSALIVLTVETEALAERPESIEALDALLEHPAADGLDIGPLGPDDHQELVRGLLGLEGSVAERVEERTAGNPLFAVQLVGDWIARGLLTPSERGFRLAEEAEEIPADMLAVWEQKVDRFLEDRSAADGEALELAALLGEPLRQVAFRRFCRLSGVSPSLDLVDGLMGRGLARPVDEAGRWDLVHGMVREVLRRRARAGDRWTGHHRACARWLRTWSDPDPERLAGHLLEAGELADALAPLTDAIRARLAIGDVRSSAWIQRLEEVLKALEIPREDPRWGELWLSWAWLFRLRGELAEAERWTVRAERAARKYRWGVVLGKALRLGARIERNLGQLDRAGELIAEAEPIFLAEGDAARAAACRVLLGDIWLQRGELAEAAAAFESALELAGDPQDEVEAWMGLATCRQRSGDVSAFTRALEEARSAADRAGQRSALANIANLQGELARQVGDLALAEQLYQEATRRYEALDDAGAVYSQLNAGLLQVQRGAYREAIAQIEPLRERAERGGVKSIPACFARVVLLPCMAAIGDWSGFKGHYKWLKRYLADRPLVDGDLARMCVLAGELAVDKGRPDGALAAWKLALAQYEGLGKSEEATALQGRMAGLG